MGLLKKVLIIAKSNISLNARSLKVAMEARGIEVLVAEPYGEHLTVIETVKPKIIIISGEDFSEHHQESLAKIRKSCIDNGCKLAIMGYDVEIENIEKTIPKTIVAREFFRPIDVKQVAEEIDEAVLLANVDFSMKHILVVDDSGMFLRTMKTVLEKKFKVSLANSASNASTAMRNDKPDLILLDYEMPICSGAQFFKMLKNDDYSCDIPVIFLTSKDDAETVKQLLSLKPEGYLLKTTPADDIILNVERLLTKNG